MSNWKGKGKAIVQGKGTAADSSDEDNAHLANPLPKGKGGSAEPAKKGTPAPPAARATPKATANSMAWRQVQANPNHFTPTPLEVSTKVKAKYCADPKGKVLISPKIGTYFPHCISSISGVLARISTNTRPCIRTCIRGCISVFKCVLA